jgi:hypothetical protein
VFPLTTENVFPAAIAGLEYMGQVLEGRTGVSRAFAGVDPSTLNKGNSSGVAINQLSTMASQRVEQIARIFASGVEYLFSVAHELIIKSGHQAEVVKLRGQWVNVDPTTWKSGRDMKIVVGYGAGNKDALVARLALILQQQKESLAMGLRVASEQNIYESQVELTKASDFSAPQRFWTDPSTLPPPQPPDPTKDPVFVMEQMKKSFDQQMAQMKIESEERIKHAELLAKDQLAKLDAEVKILIEQMKGGQSESLEVLRGAIKNEPAIKSNQSLDQIASMVNEVSSKNDAVSQQLMEALNAPREVLRGPDGKVAGVRINGKDRMVQRDKDGRVLGVQ